jgi:hypothetical protein
LIDSIFVMLGVFQQIVGIAMGTNCAPLLADLFLYSYEADFIVVYAKSLDDAADLCQACVLVRQIRKQTRRDNIGCQLTKMPILTSLVLFI